MEVQNVSDQAAAESDGLDEVVSGDGARCTGRGILKVGIDILLDSGICGTVTMLLKKGNPSLLGASKSLVLVLCIYGLLCQLLW